MQLENCHIEICDRLSLDNRLKVYDLWNSAYPACIAFKLPSDLDNYLKGLSEKNHQLVLSESGILVAWYFDFLRDSARWFALIVHPKFHGQGVGTQLMQLVLKDKKELNGWVVLDSSLKRLDGKVYKSPLNFYKKLGFIETGDTWQSEKMCTSHIQWHTDK